MIRRGEDPVDRADREDPVVRELQAGRVDPAAQVDLVDLADLVDRVDRVDLVDQEDLAAQGALPSHLRVRARPIQAAHRRAAGLAVTAEAGRRGAIRRRGRPRARPRRGHRLRAAPLPSRIRRRPARRIAGSIPDGRVRAGRVVRGEVVRRRSL